MKRNTYILLLVATLLFASCDRLDIPGMFVSSGPHTEDRVAQWLDYNKSHGQTLLAGLPDSYKFYVCSDIHVTDSAPRFRQFLQAEKSDPNAYFSILNGDLANESGEDPFISVSQAMADYCPTLADTCFVVLGNHDIYFDCFAHYRNHFHTSTYYVEVQTVGGFKDLFVFLDSGNATHGTLQLAWLRNLLAHRQEYRHVVISTHTCLFRTSYNYSTTPAANMPEEETYQLFDLLAQHQVDLFLMGHFHHKETHNIRGVEYVMTSNLNTDTETPSYLVVTCADKVSYQYVDLF